jgi:hypothetical protein
MISKKLIIPVFIVAIAGATLFVSVNAVRAQSTNPFSGLAQAISSKFNLNQTDVQNEINSYMQGQRGNRQLNMQQMQKKRLDNLISQGKITPVQETLIINELASIQSQFNPSSFKGMTQTQRQAAMQNENNTITAWANSNGINPSYVMAFGGGIHRGGFHKPTPSPSPTP